MAKITFKEMAIQLVFEKIRNMPNFVPFYSWPVEQKFFHIRILKVDYHENFQEIIQKIEWVSKNIKHSFSVFSLLDWYFSDLEEAILFKLAFA